VGITTTVATAAFVEIETARQTITDIAIRTSAAEEATRIVGAFGQNTATTIGARAFIHVDTTRCTGTCVALQENE
jgi:hypothetical protein